MSHVRLNRNLLLKVALLVGVALLTESSYASSGNASTVHFSQKQIMTFVKTVTTELELSKNWKANFSNTAGGKLYCHSVVLGEGVRAGVPGLYTWFTCSAMHRLETNTTFTKQLACTGFSSPVWIQPSANSINFQTISSGVQYETFKATAPAKIQSMMDSNFSVMNPGQSRTLIARATKGASRPTSICQ